MKIDIMQLYTLDNQFIEETNCPPLNFTGMIEYTSGSKSWWVDGKLHRLDGPAVEYADGTKSWFIDDKQVSEKQHALLYSIMKLKGLI